MSDPQLASIERSLGELRGDVKSILREIERDRTDAKESRARVYDRVERVEESVSIAGAVAAQARDKSNLLEKVIVEDVKPQTDKLKNIGIKGGGFLAGAALIGGLASAPFVTTIANAFEKVFR